VRDAIQGYQRGRVVLYCNGLGGKDTMQGFQCRRLGMHCQLPGLEGWNTGGIMKQISQVGVFNVRLSVISVRRLHCKSPGWKGCKTRSSSEGGNANFLDGGIAMQDYQREPQRVRV
jgi:hypothetical protein